MRRLRAFTPLPLLEEIEICITNIGITPTIMPLTLKVVSEVLSRVSKGIRLGVLGFRGAGAILDFNETL